MLLPSVCVHTCIVLCLCVGQAFGYSPQVLFGTSVLYDCLSGSWEVSPVCLYVYNTLATDFSVLQVFSGSLVDILVLKIQVWWLCGGFMNGFLSRNPLYFLCLLPINSGSVLDYFGTVTSTI